MKTSVINLGGGIRKIFFHWLPIIILLPCLSACAEKPATWVTFSNIDQFKSGSKVTITGYLDLYSSYDTSGTANSSCVRLRDASNQNGISVWIHNRDYGKDGQPNRMKPLGILYKEDSLVVWLNDGTQVGFGSEVTITGTLYYSKSGDPVIERVTEIT